MAEQIRDHVTPVRSLEEVLKEVSGAVSRERSATLGQNLGVKDFRWKFDQVSAKMNQAIYNDQLEQVHASCLETIVPLIEILARTKPTK